MRGPRKGCLMFRVRVLGAVLASCFTSGAFAQQSVGSLTTTTSVQPIPKYVFSAGNLSPNNGGAGVGNQSTFGLMSPASLSATVRSAGTRLPSALGASDSASALSNDPMRWTETRWAVDSYLKPASTASVYGLPTKPTMAPLSTSTLLTPNKSLLVSPRGVR